MLHSTDRLDLFKSLLRIRKIEESIVQEYKKQEMRCPTHFSLGQEAVAVGVSSALTQHDQVISTHRSHAHYLAKGGCAKKMVAELYGKVTGCTQGRGGSMHLSDKKVNFVASIPIVGSAIPIAVGLAFSQKKHQSKFMTVTYFGDGATETGAFHESINFASLHKLPILFVCENNLYSVCTPLEQRQPKNRSISKLVATHHIETDQGNGQDVEEVRAKTLPFVQRIRNGEGPFFLEFSTYRYIEHCGPNQDVHLGYRSEEEFLAWKNRDPINIQKHRLLEANILDITLSERIEKDVNEEILDIFNFALASPFPTGDQLDKFVYPEIMAF